MMKIDKQILISLAIASQLSFAPVLAQTLSDELADGAALALRVGVSGEVSEILVAPGDQVKTGQILLKLNVERYQSKSNAASAHLKAVKFKHQLDQDDFERQKELYDEGSLSSVELQLLELGVMQSSAEVSNARSAYHAAKRDVHNAQIFAPTSGQILAVPMIGQRANTDTGSDVLIRMKVN